LSVLKSFNRKGTETFEMTINNCDVNIPVGDRMEIKGIPSFNGEIVLNEVDEINKQIKFLVIFDPKYEKDVQEYLGQKIEIRGRNHFTKEKAIIFAHYGFGFKWYFVLIYVVLLIGLVLLIQRML
jgi:hypothetical protein